MLGSELLRSLAWIWGISVLGSVLSCFGRLLGFEGSAYSAPCCWGRLLAA